MADQFERVLGETLRDMLIADGWTLVFEKMGHCYMQKAGRPHRGFPLHAIISSTMVGLIVNAAGWDRARFDELRTQVGGAAFGATAVVIKAPSTIQ